MQNPNELQDNLNIKHITNSEQNPVFSETRDIQGSESRDIGFMPIVAVPKDDVMSSINFSAMAGSYNQNVSVFPVKDNSIVSNLESIREMNVGSQPFCKGERVRAIKIELYLFNNSSLDIFGKFQEFFFSKFCKVVANHASPAFFLTSLPETMPDLRDFSSEARNSGLDASNSSPSSSRVCLSNTNPNVSPFLLTTRTTLCKGNKSLNVLEFSKRTIFSFNKGITIFLPPFDFLKKVYHSYGNLSSMAYADTMVLDYARGVNSDVLWDRIISIEYIGEEHVYDYVRVGDIELNYNR